MANGGSAYALRDYGVTCGEFSDFLISKAS